MSSVQDHPDIEKLPLEMDGIAVRETIREIFRNPDNGTPDNISKVGCLALALKSNEVGEGRGHVVWNAWRAAFPVRNWTNRADFSGLRLEELDFSEFEFGDKASFRGTQFASVSTCFRHTKFGAGADFAGAQWAGDAKFEGSVWNGLAQFIALTWDQMTRVYADLEQAKQWGEQHGCSPHMLSSMWFNGSYFKGQLDFTGRQFKRPIDFGVWDQYGNSSGQNVIFEHAPIFHGCELHPEVSFEKAKFPEIGKDKDAWRAYHTLKLFFAEMQIIREEQRFFRLEMDEQTLRETGLKRGLFKAYKWFSDYGFSVLRPLLIWVAAWLVFAPIYGHSSGQEVCWVWHTGCELRCDWLGYSLRQALPLFSFDKPDHTTALAIQGVSVGWLFLHKTISLAALFLIGLALRNLFKLK